MISLTPKNLSTSVIFSLSPPIFDWNNTQLIFNQLVYNALSTSDYKVNINDFSAKITSALSENSASYKIFGSKSTVKLSANQLLIDFDSHILADYPLMENIVRNLEREFGNAFSQKKIRLSELTIVGHFEVKDGSSVSEYLAEYQVPAISESFRDKEVSYIPSIRFINKAKDASWVLICTIEESTLYSQTSCLFMNFNLSFLNDQSVQSKVDKSNKLIQTCMTTLGLELSDAN